LIETVFGAAPSASNAYFLEREEKIGETFDFEPRKIHTEAKNLGHTDVVSPNAETVSGRFSGNPSASVMTASLRSPTVPT
jgi:hypothetical protein